MISQNLLGFILANLVIPILANIQGGIPVCPSKYFKERDHHYPYVVYGTNPPQCYVASRQGPCSSGSVLFAKPNSHLGVCSCKCFLSDGIEFDGSQQRYRYCFDSENGQTYVYDRNRESCYRFGSQGPCPQGQILTKDIYSYDLAPKCVKEDVSNQPHTPIQGRCPEGEIYSELLERCTDMNFRGNQTTSSSSSSGSVTEKPPCNHATPQPNPPPTQGKCPPGTIISTLLNRCVDMNFKGQGMGWGSGSNTGSSSSSSGTGSTLKCPPGTIYSTLLNRCTDMNFKGQGMGGGSGSSSGSSSNTGSSSSSTGSCPSGTIYSTLLNRCVDMNFKGQGMGWGSGSSSSGSTSSTVKCRSGMEIYSTLLNRCVDMSFRGLGANRNQLS